MGLFSHKKYLNLNVHAIIMPPHKLRFSALT